MIDLQPLSEDAEGNALMVVSVSDTGKGYLHQVNFNSFNLDAHSKKVGARLNATASIRSQRLAPGKGPANKSAAVESPNLIDFEEKGSFELSAS